MGKFLVLAAGPSGAVPSQSSSAKAMFYDPAAGRPTPVAGPGNG